MKKTIAKIKNSPISQEYVQLLEQIKTDILQTQLKAVAAVTTELTMLYWRIGKHLSEKMAIEGWGSKVIDNIAQDLKELFPQLAGFSLRNLRYMRKFAETYEEVNFAMAIAKLPWGHNATLLDMIQSNDQRIWYAQQVVEHGWSRTTLEAYIESDLYGRQGKAIHNFKATLPNPESDLAQQTLKDPYVFDFLTLHKKHVEQDLEQGLINNVQKLLLEMGKGFALVGRQYHVRVGNKDFYIDLLFFHIKLKAYVVVELKSRDFEPRDAGQLNFYLSAVDNQVRESDHNPTIGLLLCKTKDNFVADYALQGINRPIGVAEYTTQITKEMEKEIKSSLPTIEELEAELDKIEILDDIITKNISSNKRD